MFGIKQKANILKIQKYFIPRNISKCFTLLEQFKQEQDIDSKLVTQVAGEVETSYRILAEQLNEIDTNTRDYINLCADTTYEIHEGDKGLVQDTNLDDDAFEISYLETMSK